MGVPLETVKQVQAFINIYGSDIDVETSLWVFRVLELSASKEVLIQVKQTYAVLPPAQQGGLTLFKLITDKIDARSFEGTQAILLFLSTFDILKFDGEDVGIATTRFKAAARVLPKQDRPSDTVLYYLRGMAKASCEDFRTLVNAQIGFVSMPIAKEWSLSKGLCLLAQLDEVANPLVARYEVLKTAGTWSGAQNKASVFRASDRPRLPPSSSSNRRMSREEWLQWYDNSRCSKCGKNGHPDKFCGDPGARSRTREEW